MLSCKFKGTEFENQRTPGRDIVGREILVFWSKDRCWFDAIVVHYNAKKNIHRIVYRFDDGIEELDLRTGTWILVPKKLYTSGYRVLDGAVIEFIYPSDGKSYRAMIYNHSNDGKKMKVAYIDEPTTDCITGEEWEILVESPCAADR